MKVLLNSDCENVSAESIRSINKVNEHIFLSNSQDVSATNLPDEQFDAILDEIKQENFQNVMYFWLDPT